MKPKTKVIAKILIHIALYTGGSCILEETIEEIEEAIAWWKEGKI